MGNREAAGFRSVALPLFGRVFNVRCPNSQLPTPNSQLLRSAGGQKAAEGVAEMAGADSLQFRPPQVGQDG